MGGLGLAGAKHMDVFDRNTDETIAWIMENDALLTSENFGHL